MTTTFYAPRSAIGDDGTLVLPEDEAGHAVRVLRKRPGDEVVVIDGEGGWYRVRLEKADRRHAAGVILETRRDVGEPSYALSIGMALLKQHNRFEMFLEKAVELGVREVIPLVTHRTEKTHMKVERARNLLVAAMKQCGRSSLVHLTEPRALRVVLDDGTLDLSLIAHEQASLDDSIGRALGTSPGARRIRILVGPEGGFTEEEVGVAQEAGFRTVSLGPRRLRAETAALVAASAVLLARGS